MLERRNSESRTITQRVLPAVVWLAALSISASSFAASSMGFDCHTLFRSTDDIERFLVRRSAKAAPVETVGRTSEITFAEIARDTERFEPFIPRVYARIGSEKIPAELATLTTFLDRFGGHALSVGNYGAIEGLPGLDAVHFPREAGQPPINISIKSSTRRERTNASVFINSAMLKARRSLKANYGRVSLTRYLGSKLDKSEDIFSVLGFNFDGDRPAMLVLDLSLEATQTAKIERAERDSHYRLSKGEFPTDLLLTVHDRRVGNTENASFDRLNLSVMQRQIRAATRRSKRVAAFGEGTEFSEYRIMFADSTLIVSAHEIRLDPL